MLEQIKKTIKRYALLKKNDSVLVAVSGGPDSIALLYALVSLKHEFSLRLHVAHLDHMLRKDSSKDAQFVEGLCRKLGVVFISGKADIRNISKRASLEQVARDVRFKFLFDAAKKIKADKIAIGHNLDDQAETVLMRIIRGTGLCGLAGIAPLRSFGKLVVIRPLIEVKRSQIESFLKKKKVVPRIDKTNLEDLYFRNKIRNKLLPLLAAGYNKNIKEVLSNLAENVSFDYDYLLNTASAKTDFFTGFIRLDKFNVLHRSIQRLILRLNISRIQGDTRRITAKHLREVEDLISNRPVNSIVHLPQGIAVVKKAKTLRFYRQKTQ